MRKEAVLSKLQIDVKHLGIAGNGLSGNGISGNGLSGNGMSGNGADSLELSLNFEKEISQFKLNN